MIAARGDGGGSQEEEHEEDQAAPPSPPPPPVAPQGGGLGLGRRLLGSIRALSGIGGIAAPPPAGPKVTGLGLLLHLKEDQHPPPQRHTTEAEPPSSSASSFSDAPSAFEPFEEEDYSDVPLPLQGWQGGAAAAEWPHATAGDTLCITSAGRGKGLHLELAVDKHNRCTLTGAEDVGVAWGPSPTSALTFQDCVKEECAANRPFQGQGNAGGELGATDDDNAVEDQEEGAIDQQGAAKDAITVEDQGTAVDQCGSDNSRATTNDGDHQEVAIDKHGAAKDVITVEDQETAADQYTSDKSKATESDGAVEDQETAVDQCASEKSRTAEVDGAVEDQEVGAIDKHGATKDVITVEDQEMAVDQCASEKSRAPEDDNTVEPKEKVVEQEGAIDKQDTIMNRNVVEYKEEEVVEQGIIEEQSAINDDIARDDQEKVQQQQCTMDHLRATMDDKVVVVQDVIDEKDENTDEIAVEDQARIGQCTTHELGSTEKDGAVEDQQLLKQGVIDRRGEITTFDIAVEDQEKTVEQCATYDLGTTENDDDVDYQEAVQQGVIDEGGAITDNNAVEGHEVVEQSVINGMRAATDDIAVEDQENVVEQCEVDQPSVTEDGHALEEKEKGLEQGVTDKQGAMPVDVAMKDQEKLMEQGIINNQGAMPMDDIAVKDREKAVEQYASDAIMTSNDENLVEEHKVGDQGVIDENGRTNDDIDLEEQGYVKEQVIIDELGTTSYGTALEDQKNESELCIGDEQIAIKDVVAVQIQGNLLEQKISDEQGATYSKFTVEKHKEVVEHVRHEWGATEDDPAIDTAACEGISGISSSEVVSVTVKGSDGVILKKEKVKLSVGYPQRPRQLNCPFYMSKGSCSYGFSCRFNHPPLKANSDVSSFPSEQGNHGIAEILELNRIGLPVREGARNCTHYMRNGTCRYGKSCHFNHPEQVIDAQFHTPTGWEDNALPCSPQLKKSSDHTTLDDTSYLKKSSDDATLDYTSYLKKSSDHAILDDTSYSKKSSEHATLDGTSYSEKYSDHATLDNTSSYTSVVVPSNILRMLLPPQKVPPSTEGKVMKVKKNSDWSSSSDDSDGCCSADSSDGPLCKQGHVDYPERPGRPECPFYMRFGDCKFASACKYHHSKDRYPTRYHSKDPSLGEELMQYPERPGKPECPFYMRFGDCKFASACKYHHSKDRYPTRSHSKGPSLGEELRQYPERPGKPECPFYMKSRLCRFGAQCNFHHPKDLAPTTWSPTNAKKSVAADEHHAATRVTLKDCVPHLQQYPERPGQPDCRYYMKFGTCKYLSACIFHHPKDRSPSGWHPSDPAHPDQCDAWQPTYTSRLEDLCQQAQIGPEVHGIPECPFYKKTGKCQFGPACEFYHPKNSCSTTKEAFGQGTGLAYDNFTRSDNVMQQQEETRYPERPGEPVCSHYMKHGSCKFGMNCKFDHPRDGLSKKPRRFVRAEPVRWE